MDSKRAGRMTRWLAIGGMVGTVLFLPTAFLIGETREGYRHLSQGISALSESGAPAAWAQTTNFAVVGLLLLGLAMGLQRGVAAGSGSVLGPFLIAIFAFAMIANALFPADPVGAPETAAGTVHSLTAGLGFLAVILAMFLMPRRFRRYKDWEPLASPSKFFGLGSTILMLSYLLAQEGVMESWQPWTGLLQRGMVGVVMAWLFLLALRLYRTTR